MFKKLSWMVVWNVVLLGGIISFLSFFTTPALAQGVTWEMGDQLGHAAGVNGANLGAPVDPRYTVALIIRVLLGLVGTALFVLMIYAGFLLMTAGGNDEQITQAKGLVKNSIIGLIIVVSAYAITLTVVNIALGYPIGYRSNGFWSIFF